ncbi:Tripartite-type tricarboxylate transporter, receptor component TctC [Roseovarius pacificus]|uniref:Tripartite-type tricarboxylate transporter, receptor component TctC n=2 Tax=Roseovarius pacificus TaxID=337701 RepID=A0A1M7AI17_9RHOB|nr:MFS transporter [Roseovarius pacificus]SHL42267.1 Tripartite-type tricarboxylate transporter, receptor component TctC [Roseovarius pacificus]
MKINRRRFSALAMSLAAFGMSGGPVLAQDDWPADAITVVVAYPAGGGTDTAIRAMTEIVTEELGQPILVQNVGGAGGGVAASQVARENADGYTLLATNSTSITLAPLVQKGLYDMDSFDHVAILGDFQNAIFTGPDQPYNTLDELIETVKSEGRAMTYASQLAIDRLLMHYIAKERDFELRPVPVNGGSGAVQAVLAGDVDVAFSGGSWRPIVEAGDAKSLFAASYDRLKVAPDLTSMKDLEFEFGVTSRISLHAPAGVPAERLEKISAAFGKAVNGEMAQRVGEKRSMDMTFRGYDEAGKLMQQERETYEHILDAVGPETLKGQ